jgi:hypothetical protein
MCIRESGSIRRWGQLDKQQDTSLTFGAQRDATIFQKPNVLYFILK